MNRTVKAGEGVHSFGSNVKDTWNDVQRARKGKEGYREIQRQKAGEKARKDKGIELALQKAFGNEKAKEMLLEGGVVETLGKNGYGDVENILSYQYMEDNHMLRGGVDQYIAGKESLREFGTDFMRDSKKYEAVNKTIERRLGGMTSADRAKTAASESMTLMENINRANEKYKK